MLCLLDSPYYEAPKLLRPFRIPEQIFRTVSLTNLLTSVLTISKSLRDTATTSEAQSVGGDNMSFLVPKKETVPQKVSFSDTYIGLITERITVDFPFTGMVCAEPLLVFRD